MPKTAPPAKKKTALSPKRLKQLHGVTGRIAALLDMDQLLTEVYRQTLILFANREAAVILNDPLFGATDDGLTCGRRSQGFRELRLDISRAGLGRRIADGGGVVWIKDLLQTEPIADMSRRVLQEMPRSLLAAPIYVDGEVHGFLATGRAEEQVFTAEEQVVMAAFAEHVSIAVANAVRYRREKLASMEWIHAVDALNEGIFVHDRALQIQRANRRFTELFGRPAGSVVGLSVSELFAGNGGGCPYCAEAGAVPETPWGALESVSHCEIRDDADAVQSVVHVVRPSGSAGERAAGMENLEELGGLISGVAHEVKNPLTGIIGYSELAMEKARHGEEPDEKILHYLNQIHAEGNRAYRVIHDLLYFARRHEPDIARIRVNEMLNGLVCAELRRLKKARIEIRQELGEVPDIWGDPRQILQVFANIISNAVQALELVEADRRLEVSTLADGGGVLAIFRDTGPGIDPKIRGRVLSPFFGAEDFGDGIGLGLSVAYGIVRAHKGELRITEEKPGTRVSIRLPERPRQA